MNIKALTLAAAAFSIGFIGEVDLSGIQQGGPVTFQVSEADAQTASRNTARRTARHTSRRQNSYD
ncbi:hypothetical protein [Roseibium alexandrii]|uniref:hypothetical protein n=1 Tax=Roseibium alexandrii TaxID=388408 RepID=UPI00375037DA